MNNTILDNSFYLLKDRNKNEFLVLSTTESFDLEEDKKGQMICFIKRVLTDKNNFKSMDSIDFAIIDEGNTIIIDNQHEYTFLGNYQELVIDYFSDKQKIKKLNVDIKLFDQFLENTKN